MSVIISVFLTFTPLGFASLETGTSSTTSVSYRNPLHNVASQRNFISHCTRRGIRRSFCEQMTYPNTDSRNSFHAVYGSRTPFVLMPSSAHWEKGMYLLNIAEHLSKYGKICEIRNWYRPEPYNSRVGGARQSRHLSGDAIDVEFCSVSEKNKALKAALAMRQKYGAPPGVGVYGHGSLVLHIDTSNRIYGPGIANVDHAVSRNSSFRNQVPDPRQSAGTRSAGTGPLLGRGATGSSRASYITPERHAGQQTNVIRAIFDFFFGNQNAA